MPGRSSTGPPLPYRPLAGVMPCGTGWLMAPARLQGISMLPQAPERVASILDVLDYRPAFEVIALACPVGLLSVSSRGGRACDREARRLLGRPRGAAVSSAPGRASVTDVANDDGLSSVVRTLLPRIAEVDRAIAPYWQRTVFEVNPELSFYQLNDDVPLQWSKHLASGRAERRALLERRMPGVERLVDASLTGVRAHHLLDVAACLWTARRIAARAVNRLPEISEWDDLGLRMELVR